jgi:uncharacterized protein (TIGR04255 family)
MDPDPMELELSFPRPPIVEAVIEHRFADAIAMDVVERLRKRFEPNFPAIGHMNAMSVSINPLGAEPKLSQNPVGYRLTDRAGSAIIVTTTQVIAFSRLAPYPGWRKFISEAENIFGSARDIMGFSKLNRIGVRYINRLDIPVVFDENNPLPFRMKDYLLIFPEYPAAVFPQALGSTMQCITFLPDIASRATINVATALSPVPHHASLIFDIDIGRETDVPQRKDEISRLLEAIRFQKNRIFASCLTKKAETLFQ